MWVCEIQAQFNYCPEQSLIKEGKSDSDGYRFWKEFLSQSHFMSHCLCDMQKTSGCFNWNQMSLIRINVACWGNPYDVLHFGREDHRLISSRPMKIFWFVFVKKPCWLCLLQNKHGWVLEIRFNYKRVECTLWHWNWKRDCIICLACV